MKRAIFHFIIALTVLLVHCVNATGISDKTDPTALYIGVASTDITPALPAALDGQMGLRVATIAETPLTANVLVLDSRQGNRSSNITVIVSCDLVTIPSELDHMIKQAVAKRLPALDTKKIIINATHTHTAAVVRDGWYTIPENVTQVKSYHQFLAKQVTDAIVKAWGNRESASVTWGLNYAKVAYNRRAVYQDGSARMYGKTDLAEFRTIEGFEDQSINSLFFWNNKGKMIAVCVNVASPAQVVESRSAINADYWHPVRLALQERFGQDLCVLGLIGAAGDQTPRPMYSHMAEQRMVELRKADHKDESEKNDLTLRSDDYMNEVARRIATSVIDTYEAVKSDRHKEAVVDHVVEEFQLPMRLVTPEEYEDSKKMRDEDLSDAKRAVQFSRRIAWHEEVVKRFEDQRTNPQPMYPVEVHVMRIGDVVLCTNPFELFTDFGIQMKARSKALQTFVIQLVGPGTYVPTAHAVKGGHYSAIVQSNRVGPEGGQILVDRTVEMINKLWP